MADSLGVFCTWVRPSQCILSMAFKLLPIMSWSGDLVEKHIEIQVDIDTSPHFDIYNRKI